VTGGLTRTALAGKDTDEVETAALGGSDETAIGASVVAVGGSSRRGEGSAGKEERGDGVELHGCGVERLDWKG
jgi:hypothetical protein